MNVKMLGVFIVLGALTVSCAGQQKIDGAERKMSSVSPDSIVTPERIDAKTCHIFIPVRSSKWRKALEAKGYKVAKQAFYEDSDKAHKIGDIMLEIVNQEGRYVKTGSIFNRQEHFEVSSPTKFVLRELVGGVERIRHNIASQTMSFGPAMYGQDWEDLKWNLLAAVEVGPELNPTNEQFDKAYSAIPYCDLLEK